MAELSFEDAVKSFAIDWANTGGTHSDEVVAGLFWLMIKYFPDWTPEDKEAQSFIDYVAQRGY